MTFADVALRYLDRGYAPIALPPGEKSPPQTGFTGRNGKFADADQIAKWVEMPRYRCKRVNGVMREANLGLWFGTEITIDGVAYQLAGIDTDQYDDKHGGDQLKTLVTQLGPMSDREPWISSARVDGVSGIRWFLVPVCDADGNRIELRGKADEAIEVIQRHHRYAVVWPSHNPKSDSQYWWFPPAVGPTEDGKTGPAAWRDTDELPDPRTFPVLSAPWVTYLRKHRSHSGEIDLSISVDDLYQWATDTFNDGSEPATCWNVATALKTWTRKITEEESSHDKITDAHWMLYNLGAEGHTGWQHAVTEIENHWLETVLRSGKRTVAEARAELFRSKTGALRKIKMQVDSDGVNTECSCAGHGANLWHSHNKPLEVALQFAIAMERAETPIRLWRDDWYQYDGVRWKALRRDGLRQLLYMALADAECVKVIQGIPTPIPWDPTKSKIDTVSDALRSISLLDADKIEAPCWLDGHSESVIAFQNTLLRPQDRKQIDCTPIYFNLSALPYAYDPLAGEPAQWLKFLSSVWPDDHEAIALLQEWFGYVLSGQTHMQKMLVMIGVPRSGKGTIAHVLQSLLSAESVTEYDPNDKTGHLSKESLIGKSLAITDDKRVEPRNARAYVDVLKAITGEVNIEIQRKHRSDSWQGKCGARFVFIANELSTFPDSSGAMAERMLVLETTNSYAANPDIKLREKLAGELPGIFNWALDGLDRLIRNGKFTEPESSRQLKRDIERDSSPVTQFVEEFCRLQEDGFAARAEVFERWKNWCSNEGFTAGTLNGFTRQLKAAYGKKLNYDAKRGPAGNQKRGYGGLTLKKASISTYAPTL